MSAFQYIDYDGVGRQIVSAPTGVSLKITSFRHDIKLKNGVFLPNTISLKHDGYILYSYNQFPAKSNARTVEMTNGWILVEYQNDHESRLPKTIIDFHLKEIIYVGLEAFKQKYLFTHLEEWTAPEYQNVLAECIDLIDHRTFLGQGFDLTTLVDVGYHSMVESWKRNNESLVEKIRWTTTPKTTSTEFAS